MPEDDDGPPPAGSGTLTDEPRSSDIAGGYSSAGQLQTPFLDQVLENVLENVLLFLTSPRDRNAASLVCRSWYRADALSRSHLFIGNCYAVSPRRAAQRFARVGSVVLKGKPRFADFNMMPPNWGAHFTPWVTVMASAYPSLEKIHLKRMDVTNDDLDVLARSFPSFKELALVCCEGFGTRGLAFVAGKCRQLRVLDLTEDEVNDDDVDWISYFPEAGTSLESLIFDCVECSVNFEMLERLVAGSPSLRKLRLNRHVSIEQLHRLLLRAPHLTDLGTGSFSSSDLLPEGDPAPDYASAFGACESLVSLSGFRDVTPEYLPAIFPVCANLISLNFSFANISAEQLRLVVRHCSKLRILWVLDSVCDDGLEAVAAACKDLQELRVFPVNAEEQDEGPVSHIGLQAISRGCPKLQSILYFCQTMTNEAVIATSRNCPDLRVFRLCIMGRRRPDHATGAPMDEGFGAIVMNCRSLTRLAVSGLLTDRFFDLIGRYGNLVRTLSVAFAGDGDAGLRHVLEGCPGLRKLEVRDSPFGDVALRSGLHHFYNMRFLWMSSCRLTLQGCEEVARALPGLSVEVIESRNRDEVDPMEAGERYVDILYIYRSLEGPRNDAPGFVSIL